MDMSFVRVWWQKLWREGAKHFWDVQGSCEHANPSRCRRVDCNYPSGSYSWWLVAIVSSSSWLLLPLSPAPIAWAPTSIARWSHIAAGTCHADLAALSSQRGDACWTGVQQFQERKALPLCWVYLGLLRVSLCAIRAAFPPVAVFGQEGCCAHTGETYTCTHVCPLCIFKHTGV